MTNPTETSVDEVVAAARELGRTGRWQRSLALLDATTAGNASDRARLALAAAEVAREAESFFGDGDAAGRLRVAEEACAAADLDAATRWDVMFLRVRHEYFELILGSGTFGPDGKDPDAIAALQHSAEKARDSAPDAVRRGWAHFYLGVIADNVRDDRASARPHYEVALRAGESVDDLLTREALRHLGDHDHDDGDHDRARERWSRATALGAGAGFVLGTLTQQVLMAVLARDAGDEDGATALAREIARWAGAIGAKRLEAQANGLIAGIDPTVPPR